MSSINKFEVNGQEVLIDNSKLIKLESEVENNTKGMIYINDRLSIYPSEVGYINTNSNIFYTDQPDVFNNVCIPAKGGDTIYIPFNLYGSKYLILSKKPTEHEENMNEYIVQFVGVASYVHEISVPQTEHEELYVFIMMDLRDTPVHLRYGLNLNKGINEDVSKLNEELAEVETDITDVTNSLNQIINATMFYNSKGGYYNINGKILCIGDQSETFNYIIVPAKPNDVVVFGGPLYNNRITLLSSKPIEDDYVVDLSEIHIQDIYASGDSFVKVTVPQVEYDNVYLLVTMDISTQVTDVARRWGLNATYYINERLSEVETDITKLQTDVIEINNILTSEVFHAELFVSTYTDGRNGFIGSSEEWTTLLKRVSGGSVCTVKWGSGSTSIHQYTVYSEKPKNGKNVDIRIDGSNMGDLSAISIPSDLPYYYLGISVRQVEENGDIISSVNNDNKRVGLLEKVEKNFVATNHYGFVEYPKIGSTDYCLITMYGQSLSIGYESMPYSTENLNENNLKFSKYLRPIASEIPTATFMPLSATIWEDPTISTVNCLSELYRRMQPASDLKFIASSLGEGARSLYQLSKYNESGEYYTRFLPSIRRMKEIVDAEGKTISTPVIMFMQGESGGGSSSDGSINYNSKEAYKEGLRQLKNDMQNDIISIFGQKEKPLFFTYMTHRNFQVALAQIELSQEEDDVILVNPIYQLPDYNNLHLSSNGYRWYGEYIAKAIFNFMYNGSRQNAVEPISAICKNEEIRIKCKTDYPPLVIDTWTVQQCPNYGFKVKINNSDATITYILAENDEIIIKADGLSSAMSVEVIYADYNSDIANYLGIGNVRDSDRWSAMQNYIDDTDDVGSIDGNSSIVYRPKDKSGSFIFGKKYPM